MSTKVSRTKIKVLVLDVGEAPYALIVAKSLVRAGYHVDIGINYLMNIYKLKPKLYNVKFKKVLLYPDPILAEESFILFIEKVSTDYNVIVPCLEKTQLSLARIKSELEEKEVIVPIPDYSTLLRATDKAEIIRLAMSLGIPLPKTIIADRPPDIQSLIEKLGLPFIMKVAKEINIPPGPYSRYIVVRNVLPQEIFERMFKILSMHSKKIIIQEYIRGVGIGASFIFSKDHQVVAVFGHRRILEQFPDGGPSVIAETFIHSDAIKFGARLLHELKWQGVAMTEFKITPDGRIFFMELNPRFWGTLPLAIASGIDFPKILIETFMDSINYRKKSKKVLHYKILVQPSIAQVFIRTIITKNTLFRYKIFKSLNKVFKYGIPYIPWPQLNDLPFLLLDIIYLIKRLLISKKPTRLTQSLFFGPYLDYKKLIYKNKIKTIIDLRERQEKEGHEGYKYISSNINYISFPIKDDSAPKLNDFLELVKIIDKSVKKDPVYIHCRLGRGRAPTIVMSYLILKGISPAIASLLVYRARPSIHLTLRQRKFIYEVIKYVEIAKNKDKR